jgi:hypothetical protein|nr:MAG TPA: hypothetical protein [Caudoviricetes sp.]
MNFKEELAKWREERSITLESQLPGLTSNLLEEVTELSRATELVNVIDAMLDYNVFLANAIEGIDIDPILDPEIVKEIEEKHKKLSVMTNEDLALYKKSLISLLLEGIRASIAITMPNIKQEHIDSFTEYLNGIIINIKSSITLLNYDYAKCLEEVMKAIHTRKGHWDATICKFVKDKVQPDRYEPDYTNCKL